MRTSPVVAVSTVGVVLVAFVACGESPSPSPAGRASTAAAVPVPLGTTHEGFATFYDADGTGNCSFDASPNDLLVVAPNKERWYAGSALCGACLKVTSARASVVVRVTDSCPTDTPENDCGDTGADLDLSAQAFARIADPADGRVNVTFEVVPCDVSGPLRFRFKEGSSQYWTAIQVRNHRVPIAGVEVRKDGAYVAMAREDDDYFVLDDGTGPQPDGVALRVTASDGQVVEQTLPRIGDGEVLDGNTQFH